MLSNTAVPKYYGAFRAAVSQGRIPVNREVSLEMNRIDKLIANPGIYYDPKPVEGYIAFCEEELTLTDGSDMVLLDTFKLWAEQLYGWYYFIEKDVYIPDKVGMGGHVERKIFKKRLTLKQYIKVARGAAKSMYATTIQAKALVVDGDTTHQIATAPTMKQAEETLSPLRTAMIRSRGPAMKLLTHGNIRNTRGARFSRAKLVSTKKGIENMLTNSLLEIRPMTIDKLQSLRTKVATIDEVFSSVIKEDVVSAVEQGASKLDDYMLIITSSEGTVRNGPGDDIKMELNAILNQEYDADHISIWLYSLDSIDEVADPTKWPKAQPNIGRTVSYEAYQLDVERAERAPAARNDILAKRFGLPMEGYTFFFNYEDTLPFNVVSFEGLPCSLGIDLSQGNDFCSFTFLFNYSGHLGALTRCYISEFVYQRLPPAMKKKYDDFIAEGSLLVMNGTTLEYMDIYEDLEKFIVENNYDVRTIGYDPYNAVAFINRWEMDNGPYGITKVPQGYKTESVPLGEIKNLTEERAIHFYQSMFTYTMGNCITIENTNGGRKLLKRRYEHKIDAVAALMDAYIAMRENPSEFE